MEKLRSRREFLQTVGKLAAGAAILGLAKPVASAFGETAPEAAPQVDYKWVANALPCELIKETAADASKEGFRSFAYTPDNRVHITKITFDIQPENLTVHNIKFSDGCDGSTEGVAIVAEGKTTDIIISRLKGLECNLIKSGSSCPDQLANAIEQAVNLIKGASCTYCFFAGNYRNTKCFNA